MVIRFSPPQGFWCFLHASKAQELFCSIWGRLVLLLLTLILHFNLQIDRATGIHKQKINNAGLPDRMLLPLEVTGLLVAVPVTDETM